MLKSCKKCGGVQLTKGGFIKTKQRYRCKACGRYSTDTPPRERPESEKSSRVPKWLC